MPCPLCGAPLPAEATTCPGCGTDLGLMLALQTLQLDLLHAREHSAGMVTRLDDLQTRLTHLAALVHASLRRQGAPAAAAAAPDPAAAATGSAPPPGVSAPPTPERAPAAEPRAVGAELRFGQQWLLIAGVAITVLGIGFFLKYAFEQNWVGPSGRIVLGYLAAVAFLGVGEAFRRRGTAATFGLYLTGGGLATLYLTTFAALQLYALLGQVAAFSLFVLVTILASLLALAYDTQGLAGLGLVGGFLTPVMLGTGQRAQVVLMSYMALLNGGILGMAAWKRWSRLNTLGFACTWLLFTGWFVNHYADHAFWRTMVFLHIFFLIYVLVPFLYYFVHESHERFTGLTLTALNTLLTFGYAFGMVQAYASLSVMSLVTLAYASLFLALAGVLYRRHPAQVRHAPFTLLLAQGCLCLILTVPMLFAIHWVTLFWAAQAAVMLRASTRLGHRGLCSWSLALLLGAIVKLVLYDYEAIFALRLETLAYASGFARLLPERWTTLVFVLGALLDSARRLARHDAGLAAWQDTVMAWLYGILIALAFWVLTIEVSAWCYEQAPAARFAVISVLWALFSVALMLLGFVYQQARLRLAALGLFGVTVLKVFLVDMANVRTPFRILSFVVLGLMLIGASYLYYRYRGHLLPAARSAEQP